jgi:hypothetical protein
MTEPAGFRTVQAMDEKLRTMAKSTVFERCSRRELVAIGRLFEVSWLCAGEILPTGDHGHWLHIVLEGRALGTLEEGPHCLLDVGSVWARRRRGEGRGALVALTDVTIASVATRSLGALETSCPSVASALRAGTVEVRRGDWGTEQHRDEILVAAGMGGLRG